METTIQTRNKSFTDQVNKFKNNRHLVWLILKENPQGLTSREIADRSLGILKYSTVQPRVSELFADYLIKVKSTFKNPDTGMINAVYVIKSPREAYNDNLIELNRVTSELDLIEENAFKQAQEMIKQKKAELQGELKKLKLHTKILIKRL